MRIAYLTGAYPRATDTFIQREVTELRNRGVEVETFSIRRPNDEHLVGAEQKAEHESTFYILPANPLELISSHLLLLIRSPFRYWRGICLAGETRPKGLKGTLFQWFYFVEAGILARQIQLRQIEHLHDHLAQASCTVAMLAAELGGFSYSFTLHGPYIFFEPYYWRLDKKIEKALFVSCISFFCRSQAMLFSATEHWSKLAVIHCGVNPDLFAQINEKTDDRRLLYVGRLSASKGLPILLDSLMILKDTYPELNLTVVGDGEDRNMITAKVEQLGLQKQVKFVGYQSQTEVRQYLQQSSIFVLPSFAEGVPVVLMEAMAARLPVITTQIAGVSELVEDGVNGYVIPPGEPNVLANRLTQLLEDKSLCDRLGKAGRAKVENAFNLTQEVAKLHHTMQTALQK